MLELRLSEEVEYGEIQEKDVNPELVKIAKDTLGFCVNRYCRSDREAPRLRWIRRDNSDYAFSKCLDDIHETPWLEKGHERFGKPIYGFTRSRLREKSGSIFISVEVPLDHVAKTTAHEFYHFKFGGICLNDAQRKSEDERADEFAERIVREIAQEEREKAMDEWRRRFRELQGRR